MLWDAACTTKSSSGPGGEEMGRCAAPHHAMPLPARHSLPSTDPPDTGTAGTSACFGAGGRASRAEQGEGELQSSKAALSQAARHKFSCFFSPTSHSGSLCCLKHP